jgi:hypothetical protein
MTTTSDAAAVRRIFDSLGSFSRWASPRPLRPYQLEAGEAIGRSILAGQGLVFTVCMARQSGKNELAAQLEAYLLNLYAGIGGQIVKAAPSFRPQIINSQMRLRDVLANPISRGRWQERYGYIVEMGRARLIFFSADPSANIVGATASLLLEVDEAQDVDEDVYWRELRPMASTANATTVLYGTPWTEDNILEQQRRANIADEAVDGIRRNFEAPYTTLAATSPAYRRFVEGEIARLGERHPTIRTQYLLQPVAGAGRLFPARLLDRMRGDHSPVAVPEPDARYVMGIDLAGSVVDATAGRPGRVLSGQDETVVTIAELIDTDGAGPPAIRVVAHLCWVGITHAEQLARLRRLIGEVWPSARVGIDATGVGAGVASLLAAAIPHRIEPFIFTAQSKSALGFALLAAAELGRISVYAAAGAAELDEFWRQMRAVRYRLTPGEEMQFSVPDADGHDDFVMSLALAVHAAGSAPQRPHGRLRVFAGDVA